MPGGDLHPSDRVHFQAHWGGRPARQSAVEAGGPPAPPTSLTLTRRPEAGAALVRRQALLEQEWSTCPLTDGFRPSPLVA